MYMYYIDTYGETEECQVNIQFSKSQTAHARAFKTFKCNFI